MGKERKPIMIAARERGPGPGRYALPTTCGYMNHDSTKKIQPAHTFGQRFGDYMVRSDCSPGPVYAANAKVTRYGADGTPCYSILGRQKDPHKFITPSPGAYSPEKVHPQGERNAPNYSMAARTRYRKRDANPSPNSYMLPPLLGPSQPSTRSYASYSMTAQRPTGSYCEDLSKTPGPGQYNACEPNVIRSKRPQYSLQARTNVPGDGTQKPGPGQHSPEKVVINKHQPPQHSLGIRHSEFVCPILIDV